MNKRVLRFLLWCIVATIVLSGVLFIIDIRTGRLERWGEETFMGRVVEIHDGSMLVQARGQERTILVTRETDIRRGGEKSEVFPREGDFVVVVGLDGEKEVIDARFIRILSPDDTGVKGEFPVRP